MIFGGILAGAMIDWAGIWAAYTLIAGSLLFSLPFLFFIRVKGSIEEGGGQLIRQTLDGLKYASSNAALRTLFTVSIVMEFLGFSFLIMVPVMAKNVLEVSGLGLGFLQAGVGGGMLWGRLSWPRSATGPESSASSSSMPWARALRSSASPIPQTSQLPLSWRVWSWASSTPTTSPWAP